MITTIRALPNRIGGTKFTGFTYDHDDICLEFPVGLYFYLFSELSHGQQIERVVFSFDPLITDNGTIDSRVSVYCLYARYFANKHIPNDTTRTWLYLKGLRVLYRVASSKGKPFPAYISVVGMATVLLELLQSLVCNNFLNPDDLPEQYVKYIRTLQDYHLAPSNITGSGLDVRDAIVQTRDSDIDSANSAIAVLRGMVADEDEIMDTDEVPSINPCDTASVVAITTPDNKISNKALMHLLHPSVVIQREDVALKTWFEAKKSSPEGIIATDRDSFIIVGVFDEYAPKSTEHLEFAIRAFNGALSIPAMYHIQDNGTFVIDPPPEIRNVLEHLYIAFTEEHYPGIPTSMQIIRTKYEDALIVLTADTEQTRLYFNLIGLNAISTALFPRPVTPFDADSPKT